MYSQLISESGQMSGSSQPEATSNVQTRIRRPKSCERFLESVETIQLEASYLPLRAEKIRSLDGLPTQICSGEPCQDYNNEGRCLPA